MNYFLVFVFIAFQVLVSSATFPNRHVIEAKDIVTLEGRRYYFSSNILVTVPEALTLCREINMTLAGFETVEEYNSIVNYMENIHGWGGGYFMTSGVRHADTWIWSNVGLPMTYLFWSSYWNEPDITDLTTQQCLGLTESGMIDYACHADNNFICEQLGL